MNKHYLLVAAVCFLFVGASGCSPAAKKARRLARADENFRAEAYDKAKVDYQAVLQMEPDNAVAIRQLGLIWSEQGGILPSLPFLAKTRDLNPGDLVCRKKLAYALNELSDRAGARKEAIEVLRQAPLDGEALLIVADTARTPEELMELDLHLSAFPEKDAAEFHTAVASMAIRKNDLATAQAELERAIAANPKLPLAHMANAFLALAQKNPAKARDEFKIAAELSSFRSIARLKYAEFLLGTGETDQAKRFLAELTGKAPDYIPAWRLLAQLALVQRDFNGALALLENVFSRDPQDVEGRILQSNIFLAKGDRKKASEFLTKVDGAYGGKIPGVKLQLARVAMAENNLTQAEAALEQAIVLNPSFADAIMALAELKIRTGRAAEAVPVMTELLKKRPDLLQGRLVLASAYQVLGQYESAGSQLREQLQIWPKDARAHVLFSAVLRQQNKLGEARKELESAAALMPQDLSILSQIVDMDLAEKNFAGALQRVREAMQQNPESPGAQYLEAKVYFAQADYVSAESALKRALDRDANLLEAYELLVAIYLATNRASEAVAQAETVVARQPENVQALMTLGLLREKIKQYPAAAEAYEKLIARLPNFVPALNNLAYLYAKSLNQPQKAVEIARRARTAEPTNPYVADTLGWALFKQRDYPQALALIQESSEKLATIPDVQFHLGMARYMMGQAEAAKAAFEQALKAPDDFAGKEEALRRLALLGGGSNPQALSREVLEKFVAENPDDLIAWTRLGEMYEVAQNLPKAAEAYEKARELNPSVLAINLKLAEFNAGFLQNKEKANELAKKARELAPNDIAVAGKLGLIALRTGNYQWAYTLLRDATRDQAAAATVLHSLAWAAYNLGKVDEARKAMQRALAAGLADSVERKDAENFLALTAIEEDPNKAELLERESKNTLEARPDHVPALMADAALKTQRGAGAQVAQVYEDILRRYPDFVPAMRELAAIYSLKPETLAKANELARKARKSLPDDARLARIMADISFRRKEFGDAVQFFLEASRKQSLDATSLYQLGVAELETKKTAEGLNHLRAALAAGLQGEWAADANRRLSATPAK